MACNSPLSGNGTPGANLADACVCNAAIGSVYVDTATLNIYVKTASGCTAGAWSTLSGCNCNFTLTDANANTQTLANGDTITVLGTNGIVATVSGTDTITINGLSTFGNGAPVANPTNTTQVNTYIDCLNKQFYVWCPSSSTWDSVYSFKISDGTTNQTLDAADTLTVTGQNGVKATVSATDTLTIDGLTKVGAGAPSMDCSPKNSGGTAASRCHKVPECRNRRWRKSLPPSAGSLPTIHRRRKPPRSNSLRRSLLPLWVRCRHLRRPCRRNSKA